MTPLLKKISITMGSVMLLLTIPALLALLSLGGFNDIESTYDKQCHTIHGVPGAEDIALDYDVGLAYVSSDNRREHGDNNNEQGSIFLLDLEQSPSRAIRMSGTNNIDSFHPHGLSLYQQGELSRLFVVNHNLGDGGIEDHSILIFNIAQNHLELVDTIRHPGIRSPNDLVAVGEKQFYFSNDRRHTDGFAMAAEIFMGLKNSDLSYFDGHDARVVATDLAFANGVAANTAFTEIYSTASREGKLQIYSRDPVSANLTLKNTIDVGNSPDNISVDTAGMLWIAEQYNGLKFLAHSSDPLVLVPSRVLKVDANTNSVTTTYEDNGRTLSAVSVATPYKNKLILGAVFEDRIQICDQ